MNTYPLLELHLKSLRLPAFYEHFERLGQGATDPLGYLAELAALEIAKRQENRIKRNIEKARFPVLKTLESFDFSKQPQLPKQKILDLFDCQFIAHQRSAIFLGRTGNGKTHLLTALGLAACMRGYRVAFFTAADLLLQLIKAKREHTLEKKLKALDRMDLIAIDELGFIPIEREATDLLFTLLASRYERKSVAITSNLSFEKWTQIFADELATAAIVDRLVHYGAIFEFTGQSYRLGTRTQGNQPHNEEPQPLVNSAEVEISSPPELAKI